MAELSIKLLGILFGVLARTLVPYLRKLKQGKVKLSCPEVKRGTNKDENRIVSTH